MPGHARGIFGGRCPFGRVRRLAQMNKGRGFLKGAALVGVGAVAAFAATRIQVSFAPQHADAAPPPPVTMQPQLPPPSQSQVADAKQFSRTFAQVAEQLKPAVVSIAVEKSGGSRE